MAYFNGNDDFLIALKGENGGCNPNLLINGNFQINQREEKTYKVKPTAWARTYTVDRWFITPQIADSTSSVEINKDGSVKLSLVEPYCNFSQVIENQKQLCGIKLTASACVRNTGATNVWFCISSRHADSSLENVAVVNIPAGANGVFYCTGTPVDDAHIAVRFVLPSGRSNAVVEVDWVKLEVGEVATPFSPRPYAEELALCQRYYYKLNYAAHHLALTLANNTARALIQLPTTMRVLPTITYNNNATPDYARYVLYVFGNAYKLKSIANANTDFWGGDKMQLLMTVTDGMALQSNQAAIYRPWESLRFDAEIY